MPRREEGASSELPSGNSGPRLGPYFPLDARSFASRTRGCPLCPKHFPLDVRTRWLLKPSLCSAPWPTTVRFKEMWCFADNAMDMTAQLRRNMATVLAVVWMLCVSHGLLDRATAHWHQLPSGDAHHHHHHHHHAASDQHSHAHDNASDHKDPHADDAACCEMKVRVAQAPALHNVGPILFVSTFVLQKNNAEIGSTVLHSRLTSLEDSAEDKPPPETRLRIATTQTPNSPPHLDYF